MSLRGRPLLNAGQVQVAGLWEASAATPPREWNARVRTPAWRGASLFPISLLCAAFGQTGGREARLRRLSMSAVTLRVEDPGPCARRETKATTKEVAAAGGGGGSFLSNRSSPTREQGDSSRPRGSLGGGGVSDPTGLAAPAGPPVINPCGASSITAPQSQGRGGNSFQGCGNQQLGALAPTHLQPPGRTLTPLFPI